MIDTIRVRTASPWKGEGCPAGWRRHAKTELELGPAHRPERVWYVHEDTGLRAIGNPSGVVNLEASLPRVVFGSNGRILKAEREVQQAFVGMFELAGEVAELGECPSSKVTRLDAAWNVEVEGGVRTFIVGLEAQRHKDVRKATNVYQGESIHFPGKDQRIRIYDKGLECTGQPSNVVRLEVQYRHKHLDVFNEGDPATWGWTAYQKMRTTLMDFDPREVAKPKTQLEFLQYLSVNGIRGPNGESVLEVYLGTVGERWARQLRGKVKRCTPVSSVVVSFKDLLPADHLPPVVEVMREAA